MAGYVKIPRDLFEDPSLTSVRFPRPWAIIDLIQLAKFKDCQEYVNGKYITLERGQLCKSIRQLANRWGWNERTVMRFLDSLVSTTMITISIQHANRIISINNYDQYNDEYNTRGNQSTTPNNIINNKKIIPSLSKERVSPLTDRQKKFYDSLLPFLGKYDKHLLRDFYDYWSEPNRQNTKMKCELEKTWSLERRLATWKRIDDEKATKRTQQATKPTKLDQYREQAKRLGLLDYDTDQSNSIDEQ